MRDKYLQDAIEKMEAAESLLYGAMGLLKAQRQLFAQSGEESAVKQLTPIIAQLSDTGDEIDDLSNKIRTINN